MGNTIGKILTDQRIWENLFLPKDFCYEKKLSSDPMIFFVIKGNMSVIINGMGTHSVSSHEMFVAKSDDSYSITSLEQTHLIVCYFPMEIWYTEQTWIEELISDKNNISEQFFKLPVKRIISRFLSLMITYLGENINSPVFSKIKRQELFFLLSVYYQKGDLARFLQCVLPKDIHFIKFVVANYQTAGNVQALAKLANYSTSGFIKKFQKCFCESPYKWMQRQKAKRISVEINRGDKSLQEIANEFNFSSYQHFSVFCKAQLGAPPTLIFEKLSLKDK